LSDVVVPFTGEVVVAVSVITPALVQAGTPAPLVPEVPEEPAVVKHKFTEPPIWETPPVELILVTLNV
jgi:hypothetical protein